MTKFTQQNYQVTWGMIERYYADMYKQLCHNSNIATPQVEKDYEQFSSVMRSTINECRNHGELTLQEIWSQLPGNKWVAITRYLAELGKRKAKSISEMDNREKEEFVRDYDEFVAEVQNRSEDE